MEIHAEKTDGAQGGITLKSLLQDPFGLLPKSNIIEKTVTNTPSNVIKESDEQKQKEKELELDYDPFANVNPMNAFLGPKLWDDSMLFGDKDLKFEFMDIDEFLNEHGISDNANTNTQEKKSTNDAKTEGDKTVVQSEQQEGSEQQEVPEQHGVSEQQGASLQDMISMVVGSDLGATAKATTEPVAVSPVSVQNPPSPVTVNVDFEVTHTDVALATIPGEETYDPRSKQFSEEELKPQPMITKSKKVHVPEEQKDEKYWQRRRKNNVAAKRSRNARRVKENQIVLRAAYLEKENGVLKEEVRSLKTENVSLKSVVQKLEKELKETLEQQAQQPFQL